MAAGENEWNESMIGGDGEGAGESVAILLSNTQGGTKMRERRWIIRELWMISRSLRREQTEMIRKLVGEGSKRRSLGWWGVNVILYHGVNRSFWVNDGFWWLMASSRGNWMNEALNRWWSNNFFFFFFDGTWRESWPSERTSLVDVKKKKKKERDWRNGIEVGSENELNRIHSFFLSCCIIISFFFLSSFSFFLFPFLFFNPHNQCLDTAPLTCTVCLNRGEDLRNINIVSKSCDDAFFFFFLFSFFPSFHPKHDVGIKGWKRSWIESRSDKARLVVHTYSVSNNF